LYQGVFFEDLSKDVIDFYIKVDGGKTESTVTILISKGYNNFLSSSTDGSTIKNAKNLCKEINIAAIDEHLDRAIEKQTEVFNEANKKHNKSIEKGKDLVKDKEEILKKIEANIEEQKQLKQEVENQKNALNALKSKK
jgi:vacuolar-type H+-ATPase subunit I/STV1